MHKKNTDFQSGFSLIEISLVIVIIGVIIGGIVMGQSMLQAAAVQSVIADFDKYRNATLAYRDKYGELPGDHSSASTNPSNGDGFIGDNLVTQCSISVYSEIFFVWQHLSNAQLVSVNYTGETGGFFPGINIPMSKAKDAAFQLTYYKNAFGCASYADNTKAEHVMYVGKSTEIVGDDPDTTLIGPVFIPEDAKSIDLKIDDGKPSLGKVMTPNATTQPNCATTDGIDAVYDSVTTTTCSLIFFTGF